MEGVAKKMVGGGEDGGVQLRGWWAGGEDSSTSLPSPPLTCPDIIALLFPLNPVTTRAHASSSVVTRRPPSPNQAPDIDRGTEPTTTSVRDHPCPLGAALSTWTPSWPPMAHRSSVADQESQDGSGSGPATGWLRCVHVWKWKRRCCGGGGGRGV